MGASMLGASVGFVDSFHISVAQQLYRPVQAVSSISPRCSSLCICSNFRHTRHAGAAEYLHAKLYICIRVLITVHYVRVSSLITWIVVRKSAHMLRGFVAGLFHRSKRRYHLDATHDWRGRAGTCACLKGYCFCPWLSHWYEKFLCDLKLCN